MQGKFYSTRLKHVIRDIFYSFKLTYDQTHLEKGLREKKSEMTTCLLC